MKNYYKSVIFLGLYSWDFLNLHASEINQYAEVWSLNEFYNVYPDLKVSRVFQIHEDCDTGITDNWRIAYNKRKVPCVTVKHIDGLDNQIHFDAKKAFKEKGNNFFTSTFSYMFYMAQKEGYQKIRLMGVRLKMQSEYEYQRFGMLKNIDDTRSYGIKVENPRQLEWENDFKAMGYDKVDWNDLEDVNFRPYGTSRK